MTQLLNHFIESISNGFIQAQKQIIQDLQEILGTAEKDSDADNFFSQDALDSLLADAKTS